MRRHGKVQANTCFSLLANDPESLQSATVVIRLGSLPQGECKYITHRARKGLKGEPHLNQEMEGSAGNGMTPHFHNGSEKGHLILSRNRY